MLSLKESWSFSSTVAVFSSSAIPLSGLHIAHAVFPDNCLPCVGAYLKELYITLMVIGVSPPTKRVLVSDMSLETPDNTEVWSKVV